LIISPLVIKFTIILMKITALTYSLFIFYILGKNSKIPTNIMVLVWGFSAGGCFFLWTGLFLNNFELITGGLFIIVVLAFILLHNILTKHQTLKEIKDEKINPEK